MRRILLSTFLVVAALFAASSAVGEEPALPSPTDIAPVVELIRVPEIAEKSELLHQHLRRLGESIGSDPRIAEIEAELLDIQTKNSIRIDQTEALLSASPTLDQLRDFETDWAGRLSALAPRRRSLARRAAALEDDVEALERLDGLWRMSLENAVNTKAPLVVLATIESNIESIGAISKQLHARRGVVLTLLTSVSERELEASDAEQRVSSARADLRGRLFEPDSEPLWNAIRTRTTDFTLDPVKEVAASEWAVVSEFTSSRRREIVPVAIVFSLSLGLALFVRVRMLGRIEGPHLAGSASMFERPVSVAILVTALIGLLAFPFALGLAKDVIGVILLVPILRILIPICPEGARGLLFTLSCFYLVDRMRDVIAPAYLLERTFFLGEMVAAAVVVGLLVRPTRLVGVVQEGTPSVVVGVGFRIAVGAFLIAAVSVLLGYVSFGKLLGDGALGSIYLTVVAYAAYRTGLTLAMVALTSRRLGWLGVLRENVNQLLKWTGQGLALLAVLFWLLGTLDLFAIRDSFVGGVQAFLSTPFEVGTVSVSLGDIFAFPLTLFIAFALSRAIRSLLDEDVFPRVALRRGVANATSMTVHYALLLGGFFFAIAAAGIDLGKFTLLAGAFGVGIGFGLQNVVNNFVSGLILLYERPVQVGDMIEMGGLLGEVKRIGIRASTLVTFQGAEVIVPNGNLISDQLINWTLSNNHRRVEISVGVAYGNRPADVITVLNRVVQDEERVLAQPPPLVLFRGFGDSSLNFEVRFWVRDYTTYLILESEIASAIYDELERAGIVIPFPQRDLHLKSVDMAAAAKLRGGDGTA